MGPAKAEGEQRRLAQRGAIEGSRRRPPPLRRLGKGEAGYKSLYLPKKAEHSRSSAARAPSSPGGGEFAPHLPRPAAAVGASAQRESAAPLLPPAAAAGGRTLLLFCRPGKASPNLQEAPMPQTPSEGALELERIKENANGQNNP